MAGPELIVKFRCRHGDPAGSRAGSREPITRTINSAHQHHPAGLHHQDVPFRWRFRRASSNSHCFHRSNGSSTLDLETSWSNLAIGRGEQSRSGESNSQLAVAGRVTQRTHLSERSSEFRVVSNSETIPIGKRPDWSSTAYFYCRSHAKDL